VLERIGRGQVDGIASGGGLCQKLSPTMRAMRVQGLFATHEEAAWLVGRMRSGIEAEFRKHDLVFIGAPVIGRELVFSKRAIRSMDELKRARLWRWDVDTAGIEQSRTAGMTIVPTSLGDAGHFFDEDKLDGFLTIPTVMLGFQWIPRIKHVLDWPHGFMVGCALVSRRTWDQVSVHDQEQVRADVAQAIARVNDLSRHMDEALLGGVLQKQGVTVDKTPEAMRLPLQNGDELTKKIAAMLEQRRKSR
jgi:TRAP-type C4-dicarboxylate transport system substrate-binding protein